MVLGLLLLFVFIMIGFVVRLRMIGLFRAFWDRVKYESWFNYLLIMLISMFSMILINIVQEMIGR